MNFYYLKNGERNFFIPKFLFNFLLLDEGEDMLLTTAFCLLNLPNHYRKRNKISDAKCWMERDGKGKHCICSQNFCNQLRDRRIPLQGND